MDGTLACWHLEVGFGPSLEPDGVFAGVSAGGLHGCGVRSDGALACWGEDTYGQASPPQDAFTVSNTGDPYTCNFPHNHECLYKGWFNIVTPPQGNFAFVSSGDRYSCGITKAGKRSCWGEDTVGQTEAPQGEFSTVSAGDWYACGLRTDGAIACWGWERRSSPPVGTYSAVAAGYLHSCAVRTDSTLACWGWDHMRKVAVSRCRLWYTVLSDQERTQQPLPTIPRHRGGCTARVDPVGGAQRPVNKSGAWSKACIY